MYAVELDQSKRLLVISAAQTVTAEEAKMAAQRVRELLQDVAPGFRVLADFRWLESMDSAAAPHIAKMMDTLAEKEVASVDAGHDPIRARTLVSIFFRNSITDRKSQITTFETLADAVQTIAAKVNSPST